MRRPRVLEKKLLQEREKLQWMPLNSSSLVTCIDVIASLGFPWKHGRAKNRNALIQTPGWWGGEEKGLG